MGRAAGEVISNLSNAPQTLRASNTFKKDEICVFAEVGRGRNPCEAATLLEPIVKNHGATANKFVFLTTDAYLGFLRNCCTKNSFLRMEKRNETAQGRLFCHCWHPHPSGDSSKYPFQLLIPVRTIFAIWFNLIYFKFFWIIETRNVQPVSNDCKQK